MSVRYISLFSGAGISDVGFDRAGWECLAQVEIDKQANDVRKRHFPDVQHFEDVRSFDATQFRGVDAVIGGFPCQDYSVAGQRGGLAGDKGALWWEFHRIIRESGPVPLVIGENVPGLLSSNEGIDFRTIIESLVELGYCCAWRVLDLQYFRVPQRRRRVFLVASLGSGRCAEILFEPESLQRHPAESREKRESDTQDVARCLRGRSQSSIGQPDLDNYIPEVAESLLARSASRTSAPDYQTYIPEVANTLRAEGFDASEDGTGRQTYIPEVSPTISAAMSKGKNGQDVGALVADGYVPEAAATLRAEGGRPLGNETELESVIAEPISFCVQDSGNDPGINMSGTLRANANAGVAEPIGFPTLGINGPGECVLPMLRPCNPAGVAEPFIYQHSSGGGDGEKSTAQALRANAEHSYQVLAEPIPICDANRGANADADRPSFGEPNSPMYGLQAGATHGVAEPVVCPPLTASNDPSRSPQSAEVTAQVAAVVAAGWRVRRLTPVECERLMGLPDGYTELGVSPSEVLEKILRVPRDLFILDINRKRCQLHGKDIRVKRETRKRLLLAIKRRKSAERGLLTYPVADGPRYKMLGNGWSVPQAEWLGRRVMEVNE